MGTWWKSLHTGDKIALATLLVAVLGILVTWSSNHSSILKQEIARATNGGTANVHTGTGDIHANVTNNHHQYGKEKLIDLAHKFAQRNRE